MADETFTTSVMIDCSTAHITQRDSELLADQDAMPMAVYDIPYGFLVYLGIDLIEGADELMRILSVGMVYSWRLMTLTRRILSLQQVLLVSRSLRRFFVQRLGSSTHAS